ncbi:L,D-transpeptidase family protein [Oleiharenicola lentus]|uniref:L,D-transpeptidase family protein n=1 Tax=Oleiharenicola lentus TaxID=2508720 RepID=UPI003F67E998
MTTSCAQTATPLQRPMRPEDVPAQTADTSAQTESAETSDENDPRYHVVASAPVSNWLEVQIELARRGFSSGSIDGVRGAQSAAAMKAFQRNNQLRETGDLDAATRQVLQLTDAVFTTHIFSAEEYAVLQPVAPTWLEKSQQTALAHASALEMLAERYHATPGLLRRLNPGIDWENILPGVEVQVPALGKFTTTLRPTLIHVRLADRVLQATDESGRIIVHFPVSIAKIVEKRPVGELQVVVVVPNPDYTFDPVNFPESAEGQELGRRLIIPPGPNNPVGVAWIGLNRPGYGIHGTPDPEKVGRTESHGCFRLANWDALALLSIAKVGMRVVVEP